MQDTHLYRWVSECIWLSANYHMTSMETERFTAECVDCHSAVFFVLLPFMFFLSIPKVFICFLFK